MHVPMTDRSDTFRQLTARVARPSVPPMRLRRREISVLPHSVPASARRGLQPPPDMRWDSRHAYVGKYSKCNGCREERLVETETVPHGDTISGRADGLCNRRNG